MEQEWLLPEAEKATSINTSSWIACGPAWRFCGSSIRDPCKLAFSFGDDATGDKECPRLSDPVIFTGASIDS
jgi:hypothetical protein